MQLAQLADFLRQPRRPAHHSLVAVREGEDSTGVTETSRNIAGGLNVDFSLTGWHPTGAHVCNESITQSGTTRHLSELRMAQAAKASVVRLSELFRAVVSDVFEMARFAPLNVVAFTEGPAFCDDLVHIEPGETEPDHVVVGSESLVAVLADEEEPELRAEALPELFPEEATVMRVERHQHFRLPIPLNKGDLVVGVRERDEVVGFCRMVP